MSTVTALRRNNQWAQKTLLSAHDIEYTEVEGEGDIVISIESVYFTHHGPDMNYRPVLHVRGQLKEMSPYDTPEIAYGVDRLVFDSHVEGETPTVDAFYEFTDEQLTTLVSKGYFNKGFEAPASMLEVPWTLPARYKALVVSPIHENDAPLVFIDIEKRDGLRIDLEYSGLDLAEYYPDYLAELRAREKGEELDTGLGQVLDRSYEVDDIFADREAVEFVSDEAPRQVREQIREAEESTGLPQIDTPLFNALMEAQQAQQDRDQKILNEVVSEAGPKSVSENTSQPEAERIRLTIDQLNNPQSDRHDGESVKKAKPVVADVLEKIIAENTPDLGEVNELVTEDKEDEQQTKRKWRRRRAVEVNAEENKDAPKTSTAAERHGKDLDKDVTEDGFDELKFDGLDLG